MVAAGIRNIEPGYQYDRYMPKPRRQDPYWPEGTVYDTLAFMQKVVDLCLNETSAIAKRLQGATLDQTCRNIWNFLYRHIQYKEDDRGVEQLRAPSRAWADRKTGIDCDCFSIFASTILTNLRIPHMLRITEYDYKGHFQHVYVIVPKNGKSISGPHSYYVIDPVLDQYNYEKSFTKKHDKIMKIRHQFLNGFGAVGAAYGAEFDHLFGLGNATTQDVDDSIRQHLVNTLAIAKSKPGMLVNVTDPQVFIKQLEYLLKNWNNPVARNAALEELEEMEDRGETTPRGTVSGLGCACRTNINPCMPKQVAVQKVNLLAQRRAANPNVQPATYKRGTIANNDRLYSLCKPYMHAPSMNGLNGKFFSKIKEAVKNTVQKVQTKVQDVKDKVQTAVQNTKAKVQTVVKKVGTAVKTAAKAIVQQNPVTIAARGGLLLAMKTNLFKMAERLKWGYLTEAEAVKRGFDAAEWRKLKLALDNLISTFTKMGGKPEKLKETILTGKAGGLSGTGLGVVAAASLMTAASALIAKVGGWLKNINNSKLLAKVRGGAAKAKEFIAAKLPTSEAAVTNTINQEAGVTFNDEFTADIQQEVEAETSGDFASYDGGASTRSADIDTTSAFTPDGGSNNRSAESGEGSGFTKHLAWIIPTGVVVVGGGLYLATRPKKGVNGLGLIPEKNLKKVKTAI